MAERRIEIDADVKRARTPPRELYVDPHWFQVQREQVFARSWHYVSHTAGLEETGAARPFTFLPGCLDEPLLLVRDGQSRLHCLSNVCTHRGNLLVESACSLTALRCNYHGRRFHLDGTFAFMPGFDKAEGFPTERDWLPKVPCAEWRTLLFAALKPGVAAEDVVAPVERRLNGLDVTRWTHDARHDREFVFPANWALYVENYLEGFHIPFIHESLSAKIDTKGYRYESFPHGTIQIAPAAEGEPAFALPPDHPDAALRVGAYYFWLFPTTILNVYPWGLSLNTVQPLGPSETRVLFRAFVHDARLHGTGAGSDLDRIELEDEHVVKNVQTGMRSRLYQGGRYSPEHETGVHHFHRMLARWMAGGTGV